MTILAWIRRGVLALLGAALLLAAGVAGVLAHPQPFFGHSVSDGRLTLYSDAPFDAAAGQALLQDVTARISASPLDDHLPKAIFVSNSEWRRRLFFLWNYGAGGVNYYPFAGGVFLRQADIGAGRLLRPNGTPLPVPRTLAYYAAHEIGHDFTGEHLGPLANWHLPTWIREGMADYIGYGGKVNIDALTAALKRDDFDLDPKRSGTYSRYRLLVAWFLERKGWSIDQLLTSGLSQAEAERQMLGG